MAIPIRDRIVHAIDTDASLWFPGLAAHLLHAMADSGAPQSLLGDAYGTHRWLAADKRAERVEIATVGMAGRPIVLEALLSADQARFSALKFRQTLATGDFETLQTAVSLVEVLRSLAKTVASLVRCIHILSAQPDYDVSHSDPDLPFSIFVSVPPRKGLNPDLRLAESIIHEAMHLQLSLIEQIMPLAIGEFVAYSPWQARQRPAQGLLHGVYVFAVIHQALARLAALKPHLKTATCTRMSRIHDEIRELDDFELGLTQTGRALCRRARSAVQGG